MGGILNTNPLPPSPVCIGDPAVEAALRLQNARLAALHQVALGLTSTLNLPDVLQRVVETAQTLSQSAHSHIFLCDSTRTVLTLAASRWSQEQRRVNLQPRPGGITARVALSGKPIFIPDTLEDSAYAEVPAELKPGALACLPLIKDDRVLGTLNLGYWEPHPFDADTRDFLDLLARHAALAIDIARLHTMQLEKARIEHDLEVARSVQAGLMPRTTPQLPGWEFAALWQPAQIVGGDMYDLILLSNDAGDSRQGISIADVADKGMPAALFMALTRATLRASITVPNCPGGCIAHANSLICADATDGMFVTVCHAQLSPDTGQLVYVNAGHNPPLWYQKARGELVELERTGIALGIDPEEQYEERTVQLERGDFVLFYTDGVTDATNALVQDFGKARLKQVLLDRRDASAQEIMDALGQAVHEFVEETPQFDDITAVLVKRTG
jgi:sigma-B regulation protein RsbU (phosphoserine phosphatase)